MTYKLALTGRRFGRLVVLGESEIRNHGFVHWLCRCDCGNMKTVRGSHLVDGKTQSCGCLAKDMTAMKNVRDLTGMRFGKLTVAGRGADKLGKRKRVTWECRCDCGKYATVESSSLVSGNTRSCGCLFRRLPPGVANLRRVFSGYKNKAKARGLVFELSATEFENITRQPCYYCGVPPSGIRNDGGRNGEYVFSGVDRVDNSIGYVAGNCVPCCKKCNTTKGYVTSGIIDKAYAFLHK